MERPAPEKRMRGLPSGRVFDPSDGNGENSGVVEPNPKLAKSRSSVAFQVRASSLAPTRGLSSLNEEENREWRNDPLLQNEGLCESELLDNSPAT